MPGGFVNLNNSGQKPFNMMQNQYADFNNMPTINPMAMNQMTMNMNQINMNQSGSKLGKDSRNQSMNLSMSRDSRNDLSTSATKSRSKNNAKSNKSYQNAINEDIVLIERIEGILNNITSNHNKVCPYSARSKNQFSQLNILSHRH